MGRGFKFATAALGALLLTAAPAHADTFIPPNIAAHPAPALAPGGAIATYNADTSKDGAACTAGWLVHDSAGQPGLLTAGHCFLGGGASFNSTANGLTGIGRFTDHVSEGFKGEDADMALVGIGNFPNAKPISVDTRIIGIRPVVAPADPAKLSVGQTLCHFGTTTGLQCGQITELGTTNIAFNAKAAGGDSGGPVYIRNEDGTATPVGITIRGDDEGTVAELIGPWLSKWGLTVDATPTASASPVGFQAGH
ncbi:hypothetical protein B5P44_00790 [Mycobacterium sp. CBMA 213]|uniref:Trypsin n=1 Tax=Mycolicibacterium sp. CBMA 213 TaxID=1968788 RepID=A0A343VRE5_9MYCO|nr:MULTISPECIES: S1 family peptidase [unclassified Mycolicibacterium]AVN58469.1 hypothetical protein B5P44_p00174 [Mycolicibacterium sp. CBMA 213]MUL61124.1 hypothetical protein [Mycolicibacterium sp. CBMA 335]MUM03360.1 hypothetical protein [Mycolicibacterium sp. CBMA 213]